MSALRMLPFRCFWPPWGAPAAADDIADALDQARKAYQSGDLGAAKQAADLASQLIGQKNAEGFATLLPAAMPGWTADKAETTAVGNIGFGVRRRAAPTPAQGRRWRCRSAAISAVLGQIATFLTNPQIAGAIGKIVASARCAASKQGRRRPSRRRQQVHGERAGLGPAEAKIAYAQAVDVAKLARCECCSERRLPHHRHEVVAAPRLRTMWPEAGKGK